MFECDDIAVEVAPCVVDPTHRAGGPPALAARPPSQRAAFNAALGPQDHDGCAKPRGPGYRPKVLALRPPSM